MGPPIVGRSPLWYHRHKPSLGLPKPPKPWRPARTKTGRLVQEWPVKPFYPKIKTVRIPSKPAEDI